MQEPERALARRTILITGAGDGFGAALARACGGAGAEVILLGRTVRKLEAVYDQIVDSGGPEPGIVPMDLEGASPHDYADLAEHIETGCGGLDGLVHNATQLGSQTALEHYPPLEWARVLQVNLTAPLLLTQACLPLMRGRARRAAIVFIDDGRRGAYWGAYGVSKAGMGTLAHMWDAELRSQDFVRVHLHDPGPMRTKLRSRAFPGAAADEAPPPEEVVQPVLDLLVGEAHVPPPAGTR